MPQKYAGAVGLDRSPSPGSQALAGTRAQPRFAPLQEKNIRYGGYEDPGRKVKVFFKVMALSGLYFYYYYFFYVDPHSGKSLFLIT